MTVHLEHLNYLYYSVYRRMETCEILTKSFSLSCHVKFSLPSICVTLSPTTPLLTVNHVDDNQSCHLIPPRSCLTSLPRSTHVSPYLILVHMGPLYTLLHAISLRVILVSPDCANCFKRDRRRQLPTNEREYVASPRKTALVARSLQGSRWNRCARFAGIGRR